MWFSGSRFEYIFLFFARTRFFKMSIFQSLIDVWIVFVSDFIAEVKVKSEFVDDSFLQDEGLNHKHC